MSPIPEFGTGQHEDYLTRQAELRAASDECGCCEINDYDGEDYEPCRNCGHSPEEHEQ